MSEEFLFSADRSGTIWLPALIDADENLHAEINQYKDDGINTESDNDVNYDAPYFESFSNSGGSHAIMSMNNFSVEELM